MVYSNFLWSLLIKICPLRFTTSLTDLLIGQTSFGEQISETPLRHAKKVIQSLDSSRQHYLYGLNRDLRTNRFCS